MKTYTLLKEWIIVSLGFYRQQLLINEHFSEFVLFLHTFESKISVLSIKWQRLIRLNERKSDCDREKCVSENGMGKNKKQDCLGVRS